MAIALSVIFLGGFTAWGTLAPLAGGAVAPGIISPDGSKKTVQHLEGGIIGKLLVRDGDVVQLGQPLLVLENIQPKATHDMLVSQYRTLLVTRLRLEAEQANSERLNVPSELQGEARDASLALIIQTQRDLFRARRETHVSRKRVLAQRIEQLNEQIAGFEAQVASASRQLELIGEELEGKEVLRRKQIVTKPEILRLQRMQAEIDGKRGEYLAAIAQAKQQIGEADLELLSLDAERADQIATQLVQVRTELASVRERLSASEDVLKRTVITSPASGTVVSLQFKTEGGIVRQGEAILDIVPSEDALLIDARVSPTDIDVVHAGLSAQVHLSAFSSRGLPRIQGVVRSVSADRIVDEQTHQSYYLARIEVDRDELRRIDPHIELIAGMPAEALVVTSERTMFQYLLEPFLETFRRSFREA
ncbi:HlyD family type I secretion periplasmic adaptor subunit [Microvirga roseola]|uniref:HlyD family type I secretion periplasmic adaptor subunit n=1 Tax=Microvirga roseola TaxID=2883126 RepID=UPI001E322129|nr:HlyD family type I secretion periplasmic adaptor subunit [Microvirga roseola]